MIANLAPLAVAVPMTAAAACSIVGKHVSRIVLCAIGLAAAVFETIACSLLTAAAFHGSVVHWFGGWHPRGGGVSLGIAFVVDPAAAALAAIAGFLTTAAFIFAWTFYEDDDGALHALMLVFNAALIGFFLTGDLFNLFVFFELMSVSAYALTGYKTEDASAVQGALSFAVVNSTGAFFTLAGIAIIYARTGALTMAQVAQAIGTNADRLVVVAFALIVLGFLVKAAVVPFHFWLSEAHAVAPTPLCVLFSGIMVEAGLYAVARTYWSVFSVALGEHAQAVRAVLLGFGIVTALVGAVMCLSQRHLKRLLAFSTITHSGVMLSAIALLRADALGGFFIYVLGHALVKGGLFLASGVILNRYRTVDVEELRAELRALPWLVVALVVGALGLAGLPPFGTFLGMTMIDHAADALHMTWVSPVLLVAVALTGASLLNATGRMTFGWGPPPDPGAVVPSIEEPETKPARGARLVVMAMPALTLLALGAAAGAIPTLPMMAGTSAARFVGLRAQEALVLYGRHGVLLSPAPAIDPRAGVVPGMLSTVLGLGLAAAGLFAHRLRWWTSLKGFYDAGMRIPHAWHSGIVTDYVTWLAVGSALFGAALVTLAR